MTTNPLFPIYAAIGALLAYAAYASARERRWRPAAFWGGLGVLFLAGDFLPTVVVGGAVVALAALATAVKPTPKSRAPVEPRGRLFLPALAIPVVTVIAWLALREWFEPQHATLYALGLACVVALGAALAVTRARPASAFDASRDLLDAMGWAAVLPLALAMLGGVFAKAGVGELIASFASEWIPVQSRFACVLAYALGMAAFTMIMGNAFAAFPVMTAGIALPLLVGIHGASPAPLAAIGMLSGYCGTLLTPMAANYNIVPAALLGIDQYAVIRQQVMTGLPLLATNVAFLYFIPF